MIYMFVLFKFFYLVFDFNVIGQIIGCSKQIDSVDIS